jgi:predicted metal-dependent hydrolase
MSKEQREQISVEGETITVIRSPQRQRTVSLERVDGQYVLRAPVTLVGEQLHELAGRLVRRYTSRQRRRELNDDGSLRRRADELNREFFGGKLRLTSIRYVTNQRRRYGSCTPSRGTIRISDGVAALPAWVRDYVIVHELAHLQEANHGPNFWKLVNRYPLTERARGYLMALGLEEGAVGAGDEEAGSVDGEGVV